MGALKILLPLASFIAGVAICYFVLASSAKTKNDPMRTIFKSASISSIEVRQRAQTDSFWDAEGNRKESSNVDHDIDLNDEQSAAESAQLPVSAPPATTITTTRSWYPVDARSSACRRRRYSIASTTEMSVTLVVDVPNDWQPLQEQLDDLLGRLQTTIQSLIGGAQMTINELIVVSHGPVPMKSRDAVRITAYLQTLEAELQRSTFLVDAGRSKAAARSVGFERSGGSIVVFADINVVGTVGWLKPLVAALIADKSVAVVQPHFDDATDFPETYSRTSDRLAVNYAWPLTSIIAESVDIVVPPSGSSQPWLYKSPTVHGNIFAVRRKAFNKIGGYDWQLSDFEDRYSAGAHMELSLRTWLCGATIQKALCSRVGLRDLSKLSRVKVDDPESVRRIGNLWFATKTGVLLRSAGLSAQGRIYTKRFDTELMLSAEQKNCSKIDWYFENVVKDVLIPSETALYFGQLQAKTGVCAHLNELDGVDVVDCSLAMPFELTTSGHLRVAGSDKCLAVQSDSYVVATQCYNEQLQQQQQQQLSASDDFKLFRDLQLWKFVPATSDAVAEPDSPDNGDGGRLLINTWSGFCAMHVTDPKNHSVRWRQIVMAQNCSADFQRSAVSFTSNTEQFTLWRFVNA